MTWSSLSILPPVKPAVRLAFAALLAVWVLAAHAQLSRLYLPWMDSWCYFAPGALAERPLSLHMPFMGSFDGADQTWGIHWPGAPLFFSLLGTWTGLQPQDHSWVLIGLWLLTAWLGGLTARQLSIHPWAPVLVMAALLVDLGILNIATCRRPEIVAMVILPVWLLLGKRVVSLKGKGWLSALFAMVTALTVISHPVATVAMAGAAALSLLLALLGRLPWRVALAQSLGALIGAAWFGGWLTQPHAWEQFRAHAQAASPSGLTLGPERGAWHLYAPAPGMLIAFGLCGLGLLAAVKALFTRREVPLVHGLSLVILILALGACHLFSNYHYLVVACAILWPVALASGEHLIACWGKASHASQRGAWVVLVLALFGGNAGLFAKRSVALLRTPETNIAVELRDWYDNLVPAGPRILFPDVLWEAASQDPRHQVQLLTPAYVVTDATRRRYETELYATLRSGDVVIEDLEPQYDQSLTRPWIGEHWPLIAQRDFILPKALHLPNGRFSSYQLRVYQKP